MPGYLGAGGGQTASFSITVPVGTVLLIVQASHTGTPVTSAASIGGNSMTQKADQAWYYNTRNHRVWYYLNPPTGSQTLAVTGAGLIWVNWVAYDDVDPTTPFEGSTDAREADEDFIAPFNTLTGTTTDQLCVSTVVMLGATGGNSGFTANSPTVLRGHQNAAGESAGFLEEAGSGGTVTLDSTENPATGYFSFSSFGFRLNKAPPVYAAVLGGDALAGIDETDLVAGGKVITITLSGTTWLPA